MPVALVNARVLLDDGFVEGKCVLLEQGRILAIVDESDPRALAASRRDLGGNLLLPGFIDSQVNGGRRRAFQRRSERRCNTRYRPRAPEIWHDRFSAHPDQCGSRRGCPRNRRRPRRDPSRRPRRARHSHRRPIPQCRAQGCARSRQAARYSTPARWAC